MAEQSFPDGFYHYMHGPEWQAMKQAAFDRIEWGNTHGYNDMDDPEFLKLRLKELVAESIFTRAKFSEIADQYLKDYYRHHQSIGKAYGRASRTIHQLREDIQLLKAKIMLANHKCTCGAWKQVREELES